MFFKGSLLLGVGHSDKGWRNTGCYKLKHVFTTCLSVGFDVELTIGKGGLGGGKQQVYPEINAEISGRICSFYYCDLLIHLTGSHG